MFVIQFAFLSVWNYIYENFFFHLLRLLINWRVYTWNLPWSMVPWLSFRWVLWWTGWLQTELEDCTEDDIDQVAPILPLQFPLSISLHHLLLRLPVHWKRFLHRILCSRIQCKSTPQTQTHTRVPAGLDAWIFVIHAAHYFYYYYL